VQGREVVCGTQESATCLLGTARRRFGVRYPGTLNHLWIAALLASGTFSCQSGPKRHLVKLQVFRCSQPRVESCKDLPRGAPVPADSLPPADESFQVWAWHPGKGKVLYRISWQSPFFSGQEAPVATREAESALPDPGDSSMIAYNFATATKTRYVLRVLLENPRGGIEDQDSLVWDFTSLAKAGSPPMHAHP
jgi:hypothetical protein